MDSDVSISLASAEGTAAAAAAAKDIAVNKGRRNERRSLAACEWCCKQKAKCSGLGLLGEGCNACIKRGINCIFMPKMKRGRKKRKLGPEHSDVTVANGGVNLDASSPDDSSGAGHGDPLGDLSLLASQTPYATQDESDRYYSYPSSTLLPVSALQVQSQPADFNISAHTYTQQPHVILTESTLRPSPTLSHYAPLPDVAQAGRDTSALLAFSLPDFAQLPQISQVPPMQAQQLHGQQLNTHIPHILHRAPSQAQQSQTQQPSVQVSQILHKAGSQQRDKDLSNTSPASKSALSIDDRANLATALYKPQGAGVGHFSDIVSERTAAVDARPGSAEAFLTNGVAEATSNSTFAEITDPNTIRELEALSDLPSTQRELRSLFWCWIHPQWPVIFRPTWDMDEIVDNHPALRWAMLCLSCRFDLSRQLRDVSTHLKNLPLAAHLGQVYYDRAIKSLNMLKSSLQTAQAMYFLSLRDAGQGATSSAWLLSGACLRMIYDLKLHVRSRDDDADPVFEQKKSRFVWACFVMDKSLSIFLGRPSMTHYAEIVGSGNIAVFNAC